MIPVSLYLKGFMSFRDEQTLHFASDCISLLNGPNGVGKSTVFDAILFALYGGHRGGKQNALEVLHKPQGDAATVRFEFILNNAKYRAERSVSRSVNRRSGEAKPKSTRQLERFDDDHQRWEPVPGTHKEEGLTEWVEQNLLPFEAFTTSVMLMQGKAEILIERDPKFAELRFEVLRRIVGLEFYERLWEQVDEQRQKARDETKDLESKLDALAIVSDQELAERTQAIEAKNNELCDAEQKVKELLNLRDRAVEWKKLQEDRRKLQVQWEDAEKLIKGAAQIEALGCELEELDRVMPPLARLMEQRLVAAEAEGEAKRLQEEADQLRTHADELDGLIKQVESAIELGNAGEAKRATERAELDDRDREFRPALPWLRRIHENRKLLSEGRTKLDGLMVDCRRAKEQLQTLENELAPLAQAMDDAEHKLSGAKQAVTRAEAALKASEERSNRLSQVDGKPECIYCGQLLTEKHLAQERSKIDIELAQCRSVRESALAIQTDSQKAVKDAKARHKSAATNLEKARLSAESLATQAKQAQSDVTRIEQDLRKSYDELSPRLQEKVSPQAPADWFTTSFPTEEDLQRADEHLKQWQRELAEIDRQAKAWKVEHSSLTKSKKGHENDLAIIREKLAQTNTALAVQRDKAKTAQQEEVRAREELPVDWRVRVDNINRQELEQLTQRRRQLQEQNAAGHWKKLQDARAGYEHLRASMQDLEAQQEQFSAQHRCLPETVEPRLSAARQKVSALMQEKANLEADLTQLEERRTQRQRIEKDFAAADRKRSLLTTLADLLGESQLQRHLLRQAEEQIVANANQVLDRLSGGEWRLEPASEEENTRGRALQLNARRGSTAELFGLPFLSGSEKFRCAISLALGIGQFASRQHKPIESVIIDEGFGCLDRDNRRVMVDVLAQLRGQLKCILLISHQEEFAEAFPEGYRFALENGTTRVSPMTA
ncbi:MAG TPA: SMC family ATPase [Gemmataceae bacterium]|jgi:DNA repair exonuclease SbcCD ATPase subunit|nr:SMC family ATPase [Gemmataceae bacterium]